MERSRLNALSYPGSAYHEPTNDTRTSSHSTRPSDVTRMKPPMPDGSAKSHLPTAVPVWPDKPDMVGRLGPGFRLNYFASRSVTANCFVKQPSRRGPSPSASVATLAARAEAALGERRFKEAIELFKVALRQEPRAEWKDGLAEAYCGRARWRTRRCSRKRRWCWKTPPRRTAWCATRPFMSDA